MQVGLSSMSSIGVLVVSAVACTVVCWADRILRQAAPAIKEQLPDHAGYCLAMATPTVPRGR
jgi:hypothetical protein